MTKASTTFEHRIGEKVFLFICEQDANTTEATSALCHFIKYMGQIEDKAKDQQLQEEQCENKLE